MRPPRIPVYASRNRVITELLAGGVASISAGPLLFHTYKHIDNGVLWILLEHRCL